MTDEHRNVITLSAIEGWKNQPEFLVIFYKLFQLRQSHWIRNASFFPLPNKPEFLVIFYKLFQLRQSHWIKNASFLLAIFGKCTPGKYCSDY